jgi:hypothetical protein
MIIFVTYLAPSPPPKSYWSGSCPNQAANSLYLLHSRSTAHFFLLLFCIFWEKKKRIPKNKTRRCENEPLRPRVVRNRRPSGGSDNPHHHGDEDHVILPPHACGAVFVKNQIQSFCCAILFLSRRSYKELCPGNAKTFRTNARKVFVF